MFFFKNLFLSRPVALGAVNTSVFFIQVPCSSADVPGKSEDSLLLRSLVYTSPVQGLQIPDCCIPGISGGLGKIASQTEPYSELLSLFYFTNFHVVFCHLLYPDYLPDICPILGTSSLCYRAGLLIRQTTKEIRKWTKCVHL